MTGDFLTVDELLTRLIAAAWFALVFAYAGRIARSRHDHR
jgi:hypothetical protein